MEMNPNLLLLASGGYQSLITLRELLRLGLMPKAVAMTVDRPRPVTTSIAGIPLDTAPEPNELSILAAQHRIPLLDGTPAALVATLTAARVDELPGLILSSCYPHKLPAELLGLPEHGCFNLHPSLLPEYRGPSPIFWQLRDGCRRPGVSVHRMSERLDAGALLFQQIVEIPNGSSYRNWVERLTVAGVSGFAARLQAWLAGTIMLTPQQGPGSYRTWPRDRDFLVDPGWPIPRIYNFLLGSSGLGAALLELPDSGIFRISEVLDYRPGEDLPGRLELSAQTLTLFGYGGSLKLALNRDYHRPLHGATHV